MIHIILIKNRYKKTPFFKNMQVLFVSFYMFMLNLFNVSCSDDNNENNKPEVSISINESFDGSSDIKTEDEEISTKGIESESSDVDSSCSKDNSSSDDSSYVEDGSVVSVVDNNEAAADEIGDVKDASDDEKYHLNDIESSESDEINSDNEVKKSAEKISTLGISDTKDTCAKKEYVEKVTIREELNILKEDSIAEKVGSNPNKASNDNSKKLNDFLNNFD